MASSLISKIAKLAASPQGRKAISEVNEFVSRPENKVKIEQALQRLRDLRKGPPTR